jgi:hypothetical protein
MNSDLIDLVESLSTTDSMKLTKEDIDRIRWYIKSDGCTRATDYQVEECIKHDFYYRTKHDFSGKLIRRVTADLNFLKGNQARSKLGVLSPRAWIRWAAVRLFGRNAWDKNCEFRI